MCHQLDQPSIDQDSRRYRIKHTVHDQRRRAVGRVRVSHPESDGQSYRGGERIRRAEDIRSPALGFGPWRRCEPRSKPETLERLMEDQDDIESLELVPCNRQGQADEDGVKDDTEFEDEDGCHLRRIVFDVLPAEADIVSFRVGVIVVVVFTIMAQVVLARHVCGGGDTALAAGFESRGAPAFELVLVLSCVVMVEGCEAHSHELGEEKDEDCHEGDAFDPGILRDGSSQTIVQESIIGGGEEVDEGRGYDDSGTEVLGHEEGPSGYADAFVTGRVDGEQGACAIQYQRNGHLRVIPRESTYRTKSLPR